MYHLQKFVINNIYAIKGGNNPILEAEFDIWKASLSEAQLKDIYAIYNYAEDALILYYKNVIMIGN